MVLRRLAIFLLLPVGCFAQAKWVEKPVPHWSCPAGQVLDSEAKQPTCIIPSRAFGKFGGPFKYDPTTQEQVLWTQIVVVPKSGIVRIDWAPEFTRIPICRITGDKGDVIQYIEEKKDHSILQAKPKEKLTLECGGVVNR